MVDDPLLRFHDPSDRRISDALSELLENLDRSGVLTSVRVGRFWQKPTRTAHNAAEMAALTLGIVEQDRQKNVTASKDEPWIFEFLVCRDSRDSKVLQVLTRLYNPTSDDGSIFYGRSVRRTKTGRFIMWADD